MKFGQSYTSAVSGEKFDAIVIGSGMSGLTTAALLSKAGKRVLVLERHFKVGGWTHTFKRGNYEWDVGIHYIGGVGKKDGILRILFDDITESNLRWSRMPETYDRMIFPDASYDFVSGRENFINRLSDYFPEERSPIEKYLEMVRDCNRASRRFFSNRALPKSLGSLAYRPMSRRYLKYADRTTWDVLSSLTSDRKLIGVLAGQYGDYGLTPKQSSFAIHAAVVNHYLYGAYYPVGGSRSIAETIVPVIESEGGKILVNTQVEKILTFRDRAVGVRLTNGDELTAPTVISSAGVLNTFGSLLENKSLPGIETEQVGRSCSHVCLYVGINGSAVKRGLEGTNLWIYPDYDHDANVEKYLADSRSHLPVVYVSFPSAKTRHGRISTAIQPHWRPFLWPLTICSPNGRRRRGKSGAKITRTSSKN